MVLIMLFYGRKTGINLQNYLRAIVLLENVNKKAYR